MVGELKAGRVEYRADRYGICHVPMGKVSFDTEKLVENYGALLTELIRVKPSSAKASTSSLWSSPPPWPWHQGRLHQDPQPHGGVAKPRTSRLEIS